MLTYEIVQLRSSNEPATTSTGTTMRLVAGRRPGRIELHFIPFSVLLLLTAVAVDGVPLRIANDGIDSVVLAPIGRETIIIDTASNFHVERIDSPIELIEIRLIDDNSSVPLLIDIQNVESGEQARAPQGERLEDAFPVLPPSNEESKESGSGEAPTETLEVPPIPSTTPTTPPPPPSPPVDEPYEECLNNEPWLDSDTINKLKRRRRRLGRLIHNLNRQMDMYCRQDKNGELTPYRKCPVWREAKMIHYYKLMRLTYCSDYSKWPNAQRIKRNFGHLFPLYEKLYAFWE